MAVYRGDGWIPPFDFLAPGRADTLTGGAGDDQIFGYGGDDTLSGGLGNDQIQGADGNDVIFGNDRADSVTGGQGPSGTDSTYGGNDFASGGTGDDLIYGGGGNDTLYGGNSAGSPGSGNDMIDGGAGDDLLWGMDGDDTLSGGVGDDQILGSDGNDIIFGNDRTDTVGGGQGPSGTDSTFGGADSIMAGAGDDLVYGGGGADTIYGGDSTGAAGSGADTIYGGGGNDLLWGMDGNDTIFGNDQADSVAGGQGPSSIDSAYGGNDSIAGGAGDDLIHAGGGADTIYGGDSTGAAGSGADTLGGGAGTDLFWGMDGNDVIDGGSNAKGQPADRDIALFTSALDAHHLPTDTTLVWDPARNQVQSTGPDGTDTLTNVEFANFSTAPGSFNGKDLFPLTEWRIDITRNPNGTGSIELYRNGTSVLSYSDSKASKDDPLGAAKPIVFAWDDATPIDVGAYYAIYRTDARDDGTNGQPRPDGPGTLELLGRKAGGGVSTATVSRGAIQIHQGGRSTQSEGCFVLNELQTGGQGAGALTTLENYVTGFTDRPETGSPAATNPAWIGLPFVSGTTASPGSNYANGHTLSGIDYLPYFWPDASKPQSQWESQIVVNIQGSAVQAKVELDPALKQSSSGRFTIKLKLNKSDNHDILSKALQIDLKLIGSSGYSFVNGKLTSSVVIPAGATEIAVQVRQSTGASADFQLAVDAVTPVNQHGTYSLYRDDPARLTRLFFDASHPMLRKYVAASAVAVTDSVTPNTLGGNDIETSDPAFVTAGLATAGTDNVYYSGTQSITLPAGIENLFAESDTGITITGNNLGNLLAGTTGDDVIRPGTGADFLSGGGGSNDFAGSVAALNGDTITDFGFSDRIVLSGTTLAAGNFSLAEGSTIVQIDTDGDGTPDASVTLLNDFYETGAPLTVSQSGPDTILSFSNPPCFAAGTRIATANGPVLVEHLAAGDLVEVEGRDGRAILPVRWIGCRQVDLGTHPDPELARPVRVHRGAFGTDLPSADLLLSPDHAVWADERLIPVGQLINGGSIAFERAMREVTYYHVELDHHALLRAEGLLAESYRDTGNRSHFDNADARSAAAPGGEPYAALVTDATLVRPIWERLARRSALIGLPPFIVSEAPGTLPEPVPHLLAGTRRVAPAEVQGGMVRFALPKGLGNVRLCSPTRRPRDARPWHPDRRRLGLRISRIVVHDENGARDVPLDNPGLREGWWPLEQAASGWRWTDGLAELSLPRGATLLDLRLAT